MEPLELFNLEKQENIESLRTNPQAWEAARQFIQSVAKFKYTHNFEWLGRPIIQLPQDLLALQEIIWNTRPDLIVETGIALGGSLIFHASILEILGGDGQVLGIDIDIRDHNRKEIEKHPMNRRITMIQGSSIDEEIANRVRDVVAGKRSVLVILDSNHTHEHVLRELELYSPFVTKGCYLVVFDTVIEDVGPGASDQRSWGKGNNPKTAVWEFLKSNDRFEIDKAMDSKLLITAAPDGYLRCIKD